MSICVQHASNTGGNFTESVDRVLLRALPTFFGKDVPPFSRQMASNSESVRIVLKCFLMFCSFGYEVVGRLIESRYLLSYNYLCLLYTNESRSIEKASGATINVICEHLHIES